MFTNGTRPFMYGRRDLVDFSTAFSTLFGICSDLIEKWCSSPYFGTDEQMLDRLLSGGEDHLEFITSSDSGDD